MTTSLSPDPGNSPGGRNISRPFAILMAGMAFSIIVAVVLGLAGFRYILRDSILQTAADNYAGLCAHQIGQMIGAENDPGLWQFSKRLPAILDRFMRLGGVVRIQVLDREGGQVFERTAGKVPAGVNLGKRPVIFNNSTQGWVSLSLSVPVVREPLGSLGFLTVTNLSAAIAENYGIIISHQIEDNIKKLDRPELWEFDTERLASILSAGLQLDGVSNLTIVNIRNEIVAETAGNKSHVSHSRTNIVYNGDLVGQLKIYNDFSQVRAVTEKLQMAALLAVVIAGALIYFLPVRTVRRLESSIVKLNSELESKVDERTAQLGKANDELKKDLAERERLQASILQSEKMSAVGQLTAGVAHEMNNPLGIILGFAQSVTRKMKEGDPLELPLRTIEREAVRCKNLVQNLLVFSRTSKSEERTPLDLNGAAEGALSLIAAQARTRGVELALELGAGLPKVRASSSQLQQILINLAGNAMDAMAKGGKLTIATSLSGRRPGYVEIRVRDTGHGIPKEIQKRIFDPFFTTKGVGKGTGLGLSLVYEIVQKHGGTIELESEPGKGAEFTVFLPVLP